MSILSIINWDFDPVILKLGPIQLRWYSLMFLLAFSMGYKIMQRISLKENRLEGQLEPLLYYLITGTIVGARQSWRSVWDYFKHNDLL